MTTGEGIALAIGGIAVVGGGVYLLTRKPVAGSTASGTRPVPKGAAATVGTAAVALGSGLGGLLTSLFGPSKSAPTTATIQGATQPSVNAETQSWNNTGTSTFDQLAEGDQAMGVEGPY